MDLPAVIRTVVDDLLQGVTHRKYRDLPGQLGEAPRPRQLDNLAQGYVVKASEKRRELCMGVSRQCEQGRELGGVLR